MVTRRLCIALFAFMLLAPASFAWADFSGYAGAGFNYRNFGLGDGRLVQGSIRNTLDRPRVDVQVTVIAIGAESGEPLWEHTQLLGYFAPGESKDFRAPFGRFTAEPGEFRFRFKENEELIEEQEQPQPEQSAEEAGEGEGEEPTPEETYAASPQSNSCSRRDDTPRGLEVSGSGECSKTVFVLLREGSARFNLSYDEADPITVQLLNEEGDPVEFLFDAMTYSYGSKTVEVEEAGVYSLAVLADGEWSMRVQQSGQPVPSAGGDTSGTRGQGGGESRFIIELGQ